jgi:hypothetical protein
MQIYNHVQLYIVHLFQLYISLDAIYITKNDLIFTLKFWI